MGRTGPGLTQRGAGLTARLCRTEWGTGRGGEAPGCSLTGGTVVQTPAGVTA